MKHTITLIVSIASWYCLTITAFPDFIKGSFDDFAQNVVERPQDRPAFVEFYQKFLDKEQDASDDDKRQAHLKKLREYAYTALEVTHPSWAQAIKPYTDDHNANSNPVAQSEVRSVRLFLTRYAAYQEFLKQKAQERASAWHKIQSYVKDVSNKVVHWFDSWKTSDVA